MGFRVRLQRLSYYTSWETEDLPSSEPLGIVVGGFSEWLAEGWQLSIALSVRDAPIFFRSRRPSVSPGCRHR